MPLFIGQDPVQRSRSCRLRPDLPRCRKCQPCPGERHQRQVWMDQCLGPNFQNQWGGGRGVRGGWEGDWGGEGGCSKTDPSIFFPRGPSYGTHCWTVLELWWSVFAKESFEGENLRPRQRFWSFLSSRCTPYFWPVAPIFWKISWTMGTFSWRRACLLCSLWGHKNLGRWKHSRNASHIWQIVSVEPSNWVWRINFSNSLHGKSLGPTLW